MASQQDIIHKWAHGLDHGKTNGAVYVDNGILYSYGRHFPLGIRCGSIDGRPAYLLNSRQYSVTTSKHQSWTRSATHHGECLSVPMSGDTPCGYSMNRAVCDYVEREVKEGERGTLSRGSRIRANSLDRIHAAVNIATRYPVFVKAYGAALDKSEAKRLAKVAAWSEARLDGLAEKLAEDTRKQLARQKRETAKQAKEERADLARWIAGEDVRRNFTATALRAQGDEVCTTRGACVPLSAAVALWKAWNTGRVKVGQHIGPYTLNEIGPDALVIGCHTIPRTAAQDLAARQGW